MPRYLIERTFPEGLAVSLDEAGAAAFEVMIRENADEGVTWVHSYVTPDRTRTACVYDAPGPEAVRRAAKRNGLPIDRITEVRVLNPYFVR
jgi:Nickel responsive protein SCO4226-like